MEQQNVPGQLGIWKRSKLLGSGAFSGVYDAIPTPGQATTASLEKEKWVVKVSKIPPPKKGKSKSKLNAELQAGARLLFWEYTVYMNFLSGHSGVPKRPFGRTGYGDVDGWRYLALQKLGDTLKTRVDASGGSLEPAVALDVTIQALKSLEKLHCKGLLFRDIKPENFMFGLREKGEEDKLYMVDFGACCKFIQHDGKHLDAGQGMTGTPRFMSIHVHHNSPPSRRDDIESLFYMLIYLLNGRLPWDDVSSEGQLAQRKQSVRGGDEIVEDVKNSELSAVLSDIFNYIRLMSVHEEPDYARLTRGLSKFSVKSGSKPSRVSASKQSASSSARAVQKPKQSSQMRQSTSRQAPKRKRNTKTTRSTVETIPVAVSDSEDETEQDRQHPAQLTEQERFAQKIENAWLEVKKEGWKRVKGDRTTTNYYLRPGTTRKRGILGETMLNDSELLDHLHPSDEEDIPPVENEDVKSVEPKRVKPAEKENKPPRCGPTGRKVVSRDTVTLTSESRTTKRQKRKVDLSEEVSGDESDKEVKVTRRSKRIKSKLGRMACSTVQGAVVWWIVAGVVSSMINQN